MVWEQRWHPLRREWVIISSHRNERPWQGEQVAAATRGRALLPLSRQPAQFRAAPTDRAYPGFHFHIEIHPPLRKPGLLKYLAGPEIGGGNFLNDTAPEEKAAELQAVSSAHYTEGG